ncbi:MAG: hypothetical protein QOF48_84 [Verrucomicrobiota bacterium]|jgi:hypothetical protein
MTRDEAIQILETARPAGPVSDGSPLAEALALAARDPELARFLAHQRAFDDTLTGAVKSIAVPPLLKSSILASRRIVRPHFWQDWRTGVAAAAAIAVLLIVSGVAIHRASAGFASFRKELIVENWAGDPHLDFESSDLARIRQWLARREADSDFELPAALNDMRLQGARVFESDGRKVALVCLADGARHFHLFVLDRHKFPDLPADGAPDFEKCGGWKTASWRQGGKTYVLTGMNYPAFVSKFRKAGRWSISG